MMWPKNTPKKIIVRMPNWIGDAVMATPVLADLAAFYPQAHLTAMCQGAVGELLKEDPRIDELFIFKRLSIWDRRDAHRNLILPLKRGLYDLGVLLPNSFSSAWIFWRGNVKNRLGYCGHYRRYLLNKALPFSKNIESQHQVDTYKELLSPLGIPYSSTRPELFLSEKEIQEAKQLLFDLKFEQDAVIIGINPGAAFGSAKCWLPDRFEQLTHRLLKHPKVRILYFGDAQGSALVKSICANMPSVVADLSGKTNLRQLMALIKLCAFFITNDSGPMHMASALGIPLVALFGSTNDVRTSPYNGGTVIHKHVSCSPCYLRKCPYTHFRCMKEISVDEVYSHIARAIAL